MFSLDPAAMPHLATRKALLIMDFQNDFLSSEGVLPVTEPEGFVDRTVALTAAFRKVGDIVWIRTERPPAPSDATDFPGGKILASDEPVIQARSIIARRARRRASSGDDAALATGEDADPEAFLSPGRNPPCVVPGSFGAELAPALKDAVAKRDSSFVKPHYSAFTCGQLLKILRAKFATELYLCGSLANIGVYATAMDATRHGYSITVVEDCCGYRNDNRVANAIQGLVEYTGCEVADSKDVIDTLLPSKGKQPAEVPQSQASTEGLGRRDDGDRLRREESSGVARNPTRSPELSGPMTRLTLDGALAETTTSKASAATSTLTSGSTSTSSAAGPPATQPPSASAATPAPAPQPPTKAIPVTVAAPILEADDDAGSQSDSPIELPPLKFRTRQTTPARTSAPRIPKGAIVKSKASSSTSPAKASSSSSPAKPPAASPPESASTPISADPVPSSITPAAPEPADMAADETQVPLAPASASLCEGDTTILHDVLSPSLEEGIFDKLREEVAWARMMHQGGEVPRLVAVQGAVAADGSQPVYRHPADESPPLLPFTPTVDAIREEVEKHLGHPLNHVLIQFYRDGNDYISEHSDKTLDIVRGSFICNVSLGAERTMVFRTKRADRDPSRVAAASSSPDKAPPALSPDDLKRRIVRARLPHNSLCRMGLATNMKWLHAIRQDKRADRDKSPAEKAYNNGRISLTFRRIGTFLDKDSTRIWGQGATGKTVEEAQSVVNGQTAEAVRMLQAFGTENRSEEFNWLAYYGAGFDVLHMSNAPRLFASADNVINMRIGLMLAHFGIGYAKGSMGPAPGGDMSVSDVPIKFVDNDAAKSTVQGDIAIMLYLDAVYGQTTKTTPSEDAPAAEKGVAAVTASVNTSLATKLTRFQQALSLLEKWRAADRTEGTPNLKAFKKELAIWDGYASGVGISASDGDKSALHSLTGQGDLNLVDFAVWPVLYDMVNECGAEVLAEFTNLKRYYEHVAACDAALKVASAGSGGPKVAAAPSAEK